MYSSCKNSQTNVLTVFLLAGTILSISLVGCGPSTEERLATSKISPLQFPLKKIILLTPFNSLRGAFKDQHHAADDYKSKSGTPVYSIAEGMVSFSGEIGGYGWLITVDHPAQKLYSLYGHLSKRRWKLKDGTMVKKGDIIGFVANDDEDGSGGPYPEWPPHLHFGIRKGKKSDYPGSGDNRWMAGYTIKPASSLGWLAPTKTIKEQSQFDNNKGS